MFYKEVDSEIKLALVQHSFAPLYAQLAKDNFEYLEEWLAWPPVCKSQCDFEEFIQRSLHDYADGKSMVCAIFYQNELVGNASFNTINRDLKKAEIGYWLAQPFQGKGVVTRVCQALINIAFSDLNMQKIQISVAVENKPSRSVCERLGMMLEGVITNEEYLSGRIIDHAIYGLFKENDK